MGSGRFDHASYHSFTESTVGKSTDEIYRERKLHENLNPFNIKWRESCDSPDKDESNAIIVALDVTGSMHVLADVIAREGLGTLFNRIFDDKLVTDPHVMFMGIGDAAHDQAPLQVSQFEADNRIVEQLTQLWIEHGGGGNNHESYHLPWYFAANHTKIDCFEKRGKKGYLFTVGDEEAPGPLLASQIKKFIGDSPEQDLLPHKILEQARLSYNVYHIIIEEGNYARGNLPGTQKSWNTLMGENALSLKDHTKLADGIAAIIEMNEAAMGYTASTKSKPLPSYMGLLRSGV